jgi:hypothetical protein
MYTVAVLAALTYPSQCLPDELLEAKIKVSFFQFSATMPLSKSLQMMIDRF